MPFATELSQLTASIAKANSTKHALDAVVEGVLHFCKADHAMLAVLNEDLGELEIIAGAGLGFSPQIIGETFSLGKHSGEGIVGMVAVTATSKSSPDVTTEPKYRALFPSTKSEVAVPVIDAEGRVRAVLNVESDQPAHFTENWVAFIQAASNLTSIVLQSERRASRERALQEVGRSLGTAANEAHLINRVILVAEQVLRLQACSIFLLEAESQRFVLRGTSGNLRNRVGEISYEPGEGFTGWVGKSGKSIRLHSPQEDSRWRGKFVEFPNEEIASFLAVPILTRDGCIGIIRVLRRKSDTAGIDNRFDDDDEKLLVAIADQVATGLGYLRSIQRILKDERMVAWGELSAKSSHMIGNRVFALRGDVNELGFLLREPVLPREDLQELHGGLVMNLTRIEEILQDFRDFVTATQLHLELTDLNLLITETLDEVFPKKTDSKLILNLTEDDTKIRIDPRRLRRGISELVENALLHMDNGALTIQTSVDSAGVWIEVKDEGVGIPIDAKATVFRPFYTTRIKGMGLGLSIVKGIVEAHNGQIVERGIPGKGAHFSIFLPRGSV